MVNVWSHVSSPTLRSPVSSVRVAQPFSSGYFWSPPNANTDTCWDVPPVLGEVDGADGRPQLSDALA